MHKLLTPALALFLFLAAGTDFLAAQAVELGYDHRVTGDREVTFELGPIFPQAFEEYLPSGVFHASNLSIGPRLGVDLDFYLTDNVTVGGTVKFMAASGVNSYYLFLVPLVADVGWEFTVNHFTFPVKVGAGICFSSYRSITNLDPMLLPSVGAYWNMNSAWSFGVSASEWLVFQTYLPGGSIPTSDSRIAFLADVALGAIYHF